MQEGRLCFCFIFEGGGGYSGRSLEPIKPEIPLRHLKGSDGWQTWGSGGQFLSSANYTLPPESKR